ncbi:MAG: AraC family transcriptional regulator [Pseudomonadota bacterium]
MSILPPIQITTLAALTAGQDWRLSLAHSRDEHLLIWVSRGQGRLLLNGTRRGYGTHNAIFVPAGTLFSFEAGRQVIGLAARVPLGSEARLPEGPRQLRLRDTAAINEIAGLLDTAQREAASERALVQDALDGYLALISVWLRRQITLPEHLPASMTAAARLSQRVCARIADHYASPMTISDHAGALDVTPTHLARACKTATGCTAADLLTQRVLHAARTALVETDVAMQDIARHLGFGSAAYFTRFIQAHTGKTPTALRAAAGR